jgi:hypothetical protein
MNIFLVIACVVLVVSSVYDLVTTIRTSIYQKRWDIEKANIIRIDPAVTAHELYERYVYFCKQNKCLVEY